MRVISRLILMFFMHQQKKAFNYLHATDGNCRTLKPMSETRRGVVKLHFCSAK